MTITDTINAQVKSVIEDVKALPETLKKIDIADLQKQAQGLAQTAVGTATSAYADFAKKGEELVNKAKGLKVDDLTKSAKGFADDATKTAKGFADDASKTAKGFADDATKRAEGLVDDAKATVTKVTGKKAPAKKAPVKKAPAAKKAPAKKAPAAKKA